MRSHDQLHDCTIFEKIYFFWKTSNKKYKFCQDWSIFGLYSGYNVYLKLLKNQEGKRWTHTQIFAILPQTPKIPVFDDKQGNVFRELKINWITLQLLMSAHNNQNFYFVWKKYPSCIIKLWYSHVNGCHSLICKSLFDGWGN